MDKKYISKRVDELKPWYQSIELDGIITRGHGPSSIELWEDIKSALPKNLEGMRILDLGCSAGHYSIQAALLKAKEVIGIELLELGYAQCLFLKEYFESKHGPLNVKYINENLSDIDLKELGHFDYVFALAILYHLDSYKNLKNVKKTFPNQHRVIKTLTEMSDNIVVRNRNDNYDKIFAKFGFKSKMLKKDGDRSLLIYRKEK